MTILNYFFIGTAFTFIVDLLLGVKIVQNHPKIKKTLNENWNVISRIVCITIWPLSVLIFTLAFLKSIFRK